MENLYGIGITNRYQLFLNEDEDPLEVLKVQEQEKELKKKTKLSEKENTGKGKQQESKVKPVVNARKGIKETQNIKSQDQHKIKEENVKLKGPSRTGPERKFTNENREERNNQRNRPDRPDRPAGGPGDFHREDRGERRFERRPGPEGDSPREGGRGRPIGAGPRGMGRGRGRGGRGGFDGRGKREFDRQSGSDKTGIKAIDKREGAGAHNWGSHRDAIDDMDNINQQADDSWDMTEKKENDVPPPEPAVEKEHTEGQNGVEGEEGETPANVEEERKELTLDEWKALKGNRSKPQYNLRKAGEGEDLSQWKKMYALQKKKEEEEDDEEEEYDISDYPQRVGRQKHILDIEVTFADSRIGGRGRGGRGGRGAPRGGPRGGGGVGTGNGGSGGAPRGNSSDNGPNSREGERDSGPYGGPRNSRPIANKSRERDAGSYGGPRTPRQSAPKVDDEHDFPSLG